MIINLAISLATVSRIGDCQTVWPMYGKCSCRQLLGMTPAIPASAENCIVCLVYNRIRYPDLEMSTAHTATNVHHVYSILFLGA